MPSPSDSDPMLRLADAVEAWLARDPDQPVDEFLARNGEIADLLEPLLDAGAIPEDAADTPVPGGAAREPDALPRAPGLLGDYRLIRQIGSGGMGVVYEAEQIALRRRVALKVLSPHQTSGSPVHVERFRREAAAAARVRHPGIVPVYDVGEADGCHFYTMEFVEGETLDQRISALRSREPDLALGFQGLTLGLPGSYIDQVTTIAAQISEALAAAHAEGVVHRDVKPKNILLDGDQARLVDFGLARDLDRASISHSTEVAGTPQYMSPEQIRGIKHADALTDVYAMGVLLYEMLALRCPFAAETTEALLLAISQDDPVPLHHASPRAPRDLVVLSTRAMERDPSHRVPTAAALAGDLRRCLADEPILSQPVGMWSRFIKFTRRRRAVTITAAAILLTIGVVIGAFFTLAEKDRDLDTLRSQSDEAYLAAFQSLRGQIDQALSLSRRPKMESATHGRIAAVLRTLDGLEGFATRFPDHRALHGWGRAKLAGVHQVRYDFEAARRESNKAVEILDALCEDFPKTRAYQVGLAEALRVRGVTSLEQGERGSAEADLSRAIELFHASQVDESATSAESGANLASSTFAQDAQLGRIAAIHARHALRQNRIAAFEPEHLEELRGTLTSLDELPPARQNEVLVRTQRFRAHMFLGRALLRQRDFSAARTELDSALALNDELLVEQPQDRVPQRDRGMLHGALADLHSAAGDHRRAASASQIAVESWRALRDAYPGAGGYTTHLADSLRRYGVAEAKQRRFSEAHRSLREAIELFETDPAEMPIGQLRILAHCHADLAQVHLHGLPEDIRSDPTSATDAQRAFTDAEKIHRQLLDRADEDYHAYRLGLLLHNRAVLFLRLGRYSDATDAASAAISFAERVQRGVPKGEPRVRNALRRGYRLITEIGPFARRPESAVNAIEKWLALGVPAAADRVHAARTFARCASLSGPASEQRSMCVEKAFEQLHKAIDGGAPQSQFERDASFAILHRDPRWSKLLRRDRDDQP